jgi:hypothetical protein
MNTMKKLVKAYGNGAHVVLPISMLGTEVYIMDSEDYAKHVNDTEIATEEESEKIKVYLKDKGLL